MAFAKLLHRAFDSGEIGQALDRNFQGRHERLFLTRQILFEQRPERRIKGEQAVVKQNRGIVGDRLDQCECLLHEGYLLVVQNTRCIRV